MEEKILKKSAVFVTLLSVIACVGVFWFPRLRTASEQFLAAVKEYRTKAEAERLNMTGLELMEYNNKQIKEETGEEPSFASQIRLELPLGVTGSDVEIENDYMTQKIDVRIPYAGDEYFYQYPVLGNGSNMKSLSYEKQQNYGVVEFIMERVYETRTSYDEDYFYIDFLTPQELYDKVVVIDAGYGGNETGAVKQGVLEKNINLDIVLQLKEIFDKAKDRSIGIYYTRTTDENPEIEQRKALIDKTDADLFVSICANATQSGRMSSINGTQVLYEEETDDEEMHAKRFAQICLEEVTAAVESSNKGLLEGNGDSVVYGSKVPAVLIKVGFMTNQTELDRLCSREYQSKAAQGIYNAVIRTLTEEN